jgi:hypothetical protein
MKDELLSAPTFLLILRSVAQQRVSKDEATATASWFETCSFAALLTMRSQILRT